MIKSDNIQDLAKALAKFQSEMTSIPETVENKFFKSKYADLDGIIKATKQALAANGLCISQTPETDASGNAGVTTLLMHTSGQWIEGTHYLKPVKQDPQAMGSCFTYARRYGYSAILGISTDDDDDGNSISQEPKPAKKTAPKKEFKPNPEPVKTIQIDIYADTPENKRAVMNHFANLKLPLDKEQMLNVHQMMIGKPTDVAEKILVDFCKELEDRK